MSHPVVIVINVPSTSATTSTLTAAEETYVLAVFREVARIAARSRSDFDADDIAGDVTLAIVDRSSAIMANYPDPVMYARQRTRHAGISFDRRERTQRGEGARLFAGIDGQLKPGRRVISGNVTGADAGGESHARIADTGTPVDTVVTDRMVTAALLRRCAEGLTVSEFSELQLVDGHGYTVQEVAAMRGQRRETVSRRLSNTRRHMIRNRAMAVGE